MVLQVKGGVFKKHSTQHWLNRVPTAIIGKAPIDVNGCRVRVNTFENPTERCWVYRIAMAGAQRIGMLLDFASFIRIFVSKSQCQVWKDRIFSSGLVHTFCYPASGSGLMLQRKAGKILCPSPVVQCCILVGGSWAVPVPCRWSAYISKHRRADYNSLILNCKWESVVHWRRHWTGSWETCTLFLALQLTWCVTLARHFLSVPLFPLLTFLATWIVYSLGQGISLNCVFVLCPPLLSNQSGGSRHYYNINNNNNSVLKIRPQYMTDHLQ